MVAQLLRCSTVATLAAIALIISAPASAAFTGTAAWYFTGSVGKCGFPPPANKLVAALAIPTYNNGLNCNRVIQIAYQGNFVNATVYDQYFAYVTPGDLLLSQTAYSVLTSLNNDGIKVTWDFV